MFLDWSSVMQLPDETVNGSLSRRAIFLLMSTIDFFDRRNTWLDISDSDYDSARALVAKMWADLMIFSPSVAGGNVLVYDGSLMSFVAERMTQKFLNWETTYRDTQVIFKPTGSKFRFLVAGRYRIEFRINANSPVPQGEFYRLDFLLRDGNTSVLQDNAVWFNAGAVSHGVSFVVDAVENRELTLQMYQYASVSITVNSGRILVYKED